MSGGTNILHKWRVPNIFCGDDDHGEEEEDVSKANILAGEASNLSAGARILGP